MENQHFSNFLVSSTTKNFATYNKYFEFESTLFAELRPLVYQINTCFIVELHIPALTATNYLVERLLKVALIYNEVGNKSVDIAELNALYDLPNKKYIKLSLENSIKKCRFFGLIDDSEEEFLDKKIRPLVRNTFSHANSTKISENLPQKTKGFVGNFSEPEKVEEIEFENHFIPTFQSQLFEDFAKQNSLIYFDFAFNLIFNIENRINYFQKK